MARFVTGKTFGTTETVTAALLNQAVNDAAISTDSVDNSTIEVNSNALRLKDSASASTGVTTAKIADNAVTLAKIATQADQTVLGNVSGGAAVPTAVPIVGAAGILVNNDSLGTDDTKGATQGNVKAYVDSHGITQTTGTAPYFGVRAWANYNGVTNTLNASGNIAGVVRNGTGNYTFTFTTAMPDAGYSLTLGYDNKLGSAGNGHGVGYISSQATTAFTINFYNENNSGDTMDKNIVNISVIR